MGGIGKTQMALKLCEASALNYPLGIIWLRADTEDNLIIDLNKAAHMEAARPFISASIVETKASALSFCEALSKRDGFLIVFDNVDSWETIVEFYNVLTRDRTDNKGGRFLITTRLRDMNPVGSRDLKNIKIKYLATFSTTLGAELIFLRRGRPAESEEERREAEELSRRLGGLPLALDQAGAYLALPDTTIDEYLNEYEKSGTNGGANLRDERAPGHNPQTDNEKYLEHESVRRTYKIALDWLRLESADSVTLLNLCAFLAPDNIPEFLFTDDRNKEYFGKTYFKSVRHAAVRLSLLEHDATEKTLSMHRVVQDVARDLIGEKEESMWIERVVDIIRVASDDEWHENWWEKQLLIPHWDFCTRHSIRNNIFTLSSIWIMSNFSLMEAYLENVNDSKNIARIIMNKYKHEDIHSIELWNVLGMIFRINADLEEKEACFREAEACFREALRIMNKNQYDNNSLKISIYNNLAGILRNRPDVLKNGIVLKPEVIKESAELFNSAIEIARIEHGDDSPNLAAPYNNMAGLYRILKSYDESEKYFKKSIQISIEKNKNHIFDFNLASYFKNIGFLMKEINNINESEEYYGISLWIYLNIDSINPNNAKIANNLEDWIEIRKKSKFNINYIYEYHPYRVKIEDLINLIKKRYPNIKI